MTSTTSFPPTRTSTISAVSCRRTAAVISRTRRSISRRRTSSSGPMTRLGTPAEGSVLAAKKNLLPNPDRIVVYLAGEEVIAGVQAMHTPGHTVGHTCFVINSGAKPLFVVGDLTHHVILVEKPRMEVAFDTDPKQGVETRIKVMDMLASQRMPALVYHLPWPGIGHFAKRGDGFHYVAAAMQLIL